MSETESKNTISDDYLASFRAYLRITTDKLYGEIEDLINAARDDLTLGGVLPEKVNDESDHLIKKAIGTYIKAEFGLDNDDAGAYRDAYDDLKKRLMNSDKYTKKEKSEAEE